MIHKFSKLYIFYYKHFKCLFILNLNLNSLSSLQFLLYHFKKWFISLPTYPCHQTHKKQKKQSKLQKSHIKHTRKPLNHHFLQPKSSIFQPKNGFQSSRFTKPRFKTTIHHPIYINHTFNPKIPNSNPFQIPPQNPIFFPKNPIKFESFVNPNSPHIKIFNKIKNLIKPTSNSITH